MLILLIFLVGCAIARDARSELTNGRTNRHAHTDQACKYCNSRCACAPRVITMILMECTALWGEHSEGVDHRARAIEGAIDHDMLNQ